MGQALEQYRQAMSVASVEQMSREPTTQRLHVITPDGMDCLCEFECETEL